MVASSELELDPGPAPVKEKPLIGKNRDQNKYKK